MAELVAQDHVAIDPVQTEQVRGALEVDPPIVEATGSGTCPGLAVRLPQGSWIGGGRLGGGSGEFRFRLPEIKLAREQALAVPEALRGQVEAVRLEPEGTVGAILVIDLLGDTQAHEKPSSDPAVITLEFDGSSCPEPEPVAKGLPQARPPATSSTAELLDRAEEAIRMGDDAQASAMVAQILAGGESPDTPRARELSGILAVRAGRREEARAIFTAYIADYPDHEAVPRITMRLGELDSGEPRSGEAAVRPSAEGTSERTSGSASPKWRTSLRGFFSQYYIYDRSRAQIRDETGTFPPGFVDERINVDELLTIADTTFIATDGSSTIEGRASAGYVAEFRPVQLTGSDRNGGSYSLLDELYLSATFGELGHRITVGRQKEYGLGIFGRFDGLAISASPTHGLVVRAALGRPVWSERQTSINDDQSFYAIGVDFSGGDDRWNAGFYWFDQRASGERDRQAIGAQFRAGGDMWQLGGLVDYDIAFDTLNAAYLRGSLAWSNGASASVTGRVQHYPSLALTNAIIGQADPRLDTILGLENLDTVRQAARDRSLEYRSLNLAGTLPIAQDWRLAADVEVSSLSGDPGSVGVPAFLATGTEYRASVQAMAANLFRTRDSLLAAFEIADQRQFKAASADIYYQFPLGANAYVAPRVRVLRRVQKEGPGAHTTFYPSIRVTWRLAPKAEVEAQVGRIYRDERYVNYDWSGMREERSFVAHIGYTLRF